MKIAAFYENIEEGARCAGVSVESAVRRLMECGLELLYIGSVPFGHDLNEVKGLIEKCGIGVEGIHGWVDFAHNPETRQYEEVILDAAELHANNVLIVPGMCREGENREKIILNIEGGMKKAIAFAEQYGIPVTMEDFDGMDAPYCTMGGMEHFFQALPELKCSFDTGNFIMYKENELEAFHRFKDRICTLHLKDRKTERIHADEKFKICADGSKSFVAPIGQGTMQIKEILDELRKDHYSGNVIVELYDYSPSHMLEGFQESIEWLRRWQSGCDDEEQMMNTERN